jgi:tetratricopeptide (TPR) repeat protein
MKKAIVFIISALVFQFTNAQTPVFEKAKLLQAQFDYVGALNVLNETSGLDSIESVNLKVTLLKGLNRYEDATKLLENYLIKDSLNLKIINELADCYRQVGKLQPAANCYLKALKIVDYQYFRLQLGNTYILQDNYQAAITVFSELLMKDTANYLFVKQLARCYEASNQSVLALGLYSKYFVKYPNDAIVCNKMMNLNIKLTKYDDGLELGQNFVTKDSSNWSVNRTLAYLFYLKKKYQSSISRFKYCLSTGDSSNFAHKYLGMAYYGAEAYQDAKKYLEKAFLQDTTDFRTCYFTGVSAVRSISHDDGFGYLNKTLGLLKPHISYLSSAHQNIAENYNFIRKPKEALEHLLIAKGINRADTVLLYTIASQYDNYLFDDEKALVAYQEFVNTAPAKAPVKKDNPHEVSYYRVAENRIANILKKQAAKSSANEK